MKRTNFLESIVLSTCLLAVSIVTNAFEVDGIYYSYDDSGVTVSTGEVKYSGNVIIPETVTYNGTTYRVTGIGNYAFYNCSGLLSVSMPNSVTTIGEWAFADCTELKNVYFSNSLTSIGFRAFSDCHSLLDVTFGHNLKTISDLAFLYCWSLKSIHIPSTLTSIGRRNPFAGCCSLISLDVESGNLKYDSRNNCNAIIDTENNTLVTGCMNTIIPYGVEIIGHGAFDGCTGLRTINIPNSVVLIDTAAFTDCTGLTNIRIPNSVIEIGTDGFARCESLKEIKIPNSVTTLGKEVFFYCKGLQSLEITNSVITIGNSLLTGCSNLKNLTVTGIGEWQGGAISRSISNIYIDSNITSINDIRIKGTNIYCYATTPPICNENSFTNYLGTLHVPAASLAAYFTAPYWCNFANIVGDAVEPIDVNINNANVEIPLGEQLSLKATVNPSNATPNTVTWESTNTDIATVENGIVTALSLGECDIIAKCLYTEAICHVVVKSTSIIITLNQNEAQVLPNHIITLTPSSSSDVLPELAVTSSAPSVAAARIVNGNVQVVGIKEGMAVITVGSIDDTARPATCLVTVYTDPGDVNCDGFVSIGDVSQLINHLLGGEVDNFKFANADLNNDGKVSINDVTKLINILLSSN